MDIDGNDGSGRDVKDPIEEAEGKVVGIPTIAPNGAAETGAGTIRTAADT